MQMPGSYYEKAWKHQMARTHFASLCFNYSPVRCCAMHALRVECNQIHWLDEGKPGSRAECLSCLHCRMQATEIARYSIYEMMRGSILRCEQ